MKTHPFFFQRPDAQPPDASREAWLDACRSGSTKAIVGLYDLHHQRVRRLARRLLGDDGAAEDVVQEVFVAIPKAMRAYRGDADLVSFLLGVTVKKSRGHLRLAMRRRRLLERYAVETPAGPRDPEQDLARKELALALTHAMDSLSVAHREAFVLCEVEGMSRVDAAGVLEIPEGTVRTRLFHARAQLRVLLGEARR
jgi:RNA polymerase sigma-70 factor, ECF subfamily